MKDHIPAALHWENVGYRIGSKALLDGITGSVKPGEVMAIVGASGAGKTTFLDILARREKRGTTSGSILIKEGRCRIRSTSASLASSTRKICSWKL